MSFYAGVVPADGRSAQAAISRSHIQTSPQSLNTVGATSPPATQFSAYGASVTPAQAYARSVVSGQPTLQYTIERQQTNVSNQQLAPLQSLVEDSASVRGQSYAQRLYASALGNQPQPQSKLQTDNRNSSSESGPPASDVQILAPGGPSCTYGPRSRMVSSLILDAQHNNTSSQSASPLDFYHGSVSKLGLQSSVPDQSARPTGPRRPQPIMNFSRVSVPHSPHPLISQTSQAPSDTQTSSRINVITVNVPTSDVPLPSQALDHELTSSVGMCDMSPSAISPSENNVTLLDFAQVSPRSHATMVFSPNSEDQSVDHTELIGTPSRSRSETQNNHLPPSPERTGVDLIPEDVPLYSLVDETPPPPDFDESQSICHTNPPLSMYHADAVLSSPNAPSSLQLHDFSAVHGTVPSSSTGTPAPPTPSPCPSPETLRPFSAVEIPSYRPEQGFVYVTEGSDSYSVEKPVSCLPEKARTYAIKDSNERRGYNITSTDIQRSPAPSSVAMHYGGVSNTSANAIRAPPAPPQTLLAASIPPPITVPTPPPAPSIVSPQRPSAVGPVNVRPATSRPRLLDSAIQPSIPPPLPPRVKSGSVSSPSSASTPSISGFAKITSQTYPTASHSPLPSFTQHSQVPSVPSALSTDNRPAEIRYQLPPSISRGDAQVPYQSPIQGFQPRTSSSPPQHAGAQNRTVTARSPQSSRNFGTIAAGVAGGALGLLSGAVFAEALGGNDIVDDLAGNMAGMTFGDPTGGVLDSNMGAGDQLSGSGFDPAAGFQGDQIFSGDSFVATYDTSDPNLGYGLNSYQTDGFQGDQAFSGDSFVATYDTGDPNLGYGLDSYQTDGFQGQSSIQPDSYFASEQFQEVQQVDITETYNISQNQQQPQQSNDQNSGTHYMHDAGRILQGGYKIYQAMQQNGATQSPQTTAPSQQFTNPGMSSQNTSLNSPPMNHISASSTGPNVGAPAGVAPVPSQGTYFTHPATTTTQYIGQTMHVATPPAVQPPTFSQHHPSTNPVSHYTHSHHHVATQGSHAQNSYVNHSAYSSGNAAPTVPSHGLMQTQHAMHYGASYPHGTSPHQTPPGSYVHGQYPTHPNTHLPQGSFLQSNAVQHPTGVSAIQNKAEIARKFVKGALIAGGALAKYNRMTGGGGFIGNNGNGGSSGLF